MRLYLHNRKWMIFSATWVLIASLDAFAQGPPINTDSPILLGLDGSGIRTFGRIIYRGTLLQNGSEVNDPSNTRIRVWASPVVVPYNLFSDKLQMRLIIPFLNIDVNSNNGDKKTKLYDDLGYH